MAERNVSDVLVERLGAWGVDRIFGYSGDGINGLMEALQRAGNQPRFIQARHEEWAAFMAVGHAKYTGEVGVVTSTQGPGAVHLLNGLYDAKLDNVPVVAIVGQQATSVLGSGYMQEINLPVLFSDVASFVQSVASAEQIPMVIDRAFRSALANRAPAVVIVPHDIQKETAPELEHEHGILRTASEYRAPRVLPHVDDLTAAAEVLAAGERVALLVGQGAMSAQDEVVAIADALGAGIATSLLGKPFVDESLTNAVGTMGHLGTTSSAYLFDHCDTLLIVGSNDPWTEFYPAPGQARAVQIDIDGEVVGNRYPVEVGLVGDAAMTLGALLPRIAELREKHPRSGEWRDAVEKSVGRWQRIARQRASVPATPVNPERVLAELGPILPNDALLALDVGSVVYWYGRQLRLPRGVVAQVSGTLASMGCGVPYGIAGKLAAPDRPMVVLSGDGGFQMSGVTELITVSRLWTEWEDPRFIVCVLNNGDLAEVSWEQREMEGGPRFDESQDLPRFPAAEYAELLGLNGERVDDPDELENAWSRAFESDRPHVLEVMTDASIPLLPPFPAGREKLEQMRAALDEEGESGEHARELLDRYASHEDSDRD
ncbi:thiamine pyrophosphate-requiring protein [Mycetocola manganoxydans]|uniref:Thiamine pyrophosphate-requiring protein n=1 Tax=Mycetocola manganoxydans TaxID=699879 RepID=A0A3L6ZLY7_9MICO|nr:thiamine pyrophosphate-requiring protein [Mycetocola manganoxydans]RLP68848.1 thiamine pyrophosphate-requiring protein [Mycetocola manganoxydans]GHD51184.1 thiamine pyrophosphate-requiring protein [Mycetocola manganoxydans]